MEETQRIINEVLMDMENSLSNEQIFMLENVLTRNLHDYEIKKTTYEIVERNEDANRRQIKLFVASRKLEGMSSATMRQYVYYIEKLLQFLNSKSLQDITSVDIKFFLSEYERIKKVQKRTVDNARRAIAGFFKFLIENGTINDNPCAKIHSIAYEKKPIEILTSNEIFEIREISRNNIRNRAIIEVLLATGVRVSELCSINITDVDLTRHEILIKSAKKRNHESRSVFLTADAVCTLSKYMEYRREKGYMDNPALFVANRKNGKRITERIVNGMLKDIQQEIPYFSKHLTVHIFRKTLASRLHAMGMPSLQISFILGHADTRMSETYYITCKKEDVKAGYARLYF